MANGGLAPGSATAGGRAELAGEGIYTCQQPLYLLMANSLAALREQYLPWWRLMFLTLLSLPAGAAIGAVAVLGVAWPIHWLQWNENFIYVTFFVPVALGLLWLTARLKGWLPHVELLHTSGGGQRLRFHRLNMALGRGVAVNSLLIGVFFGIHTQLIYQTVDHSGLGSAVSWWEAGRLAATNFFDAVTLGLTRLLGIGFADRPQHTTLSATVFWLFTAAYDAHILLVLAAIRRRRAVVHLAHDFDRYLAIPSPANLAAYVQAVCYNPQRWSKLFHDEFMVFCHVERCLSRDYGTCRSLRVLFPELSAPDQVYAMLLDGNGHSVFRTPAR